MTVHKHCLVLINILHVYIILCKLLVIMSFFTEKCTTSIHGSSHGSTLCIYCSLFGLHKCIPATKLVAAFIKMFFMLWRLQTVSLFNYLANFNSFNKNSLAVKPVFQHFHCNDRCQLTFQRTGKKAV